VIVPSSIVPTEISSEANNISGRAPKRSPSQPIAIVAGSPSRKARE
jgi:hypothetical protein